MVSSNYCPVSLILKLNVNDNAIISFSVLNEISCTKVIHHVDWAPFKSSRGKACSIATVPQ